MKNWILPLTLGTIAMSGCATFVAGAPKGAIDVIAHRGASAYAPENTLAAFRLGQELGADWLELDCRLSQDSEVVVIHDDSVDRTTDGQGQVRDLTLVELKRLDAGSKKDPAFKGEPIPTLAEALDLARGRTGVYIEIKDDDDDTDSMDRILGVAGKDAGAPSVGTPSAGAQGRDKASEGLLRDMQKRIQDSGTRNLELTRKVIALVRERRMRRQVVIQSFSPIVCAIALAEAPGLRTEFLGAEDKNHPDRWKAYLRWASLLPVAGMNINKDSTTEERVKVIHQSGRTVAVWTVDAEEDMRRLADWGVDAIISNRPDLCLRVLQDLKLRPR